MMKRITAIITVFLLLSLIPAAGMAATATDIEAAQALLNVYSADELLQMWTEIGQALRLNGYYPFSELEKGDTGYEVVQLQTQLTALSYYQKTIVDEFGNGTYNAMREFEKANGLAVNGIASVEDQQLLYQKAAELTAAAESSTDGLISSYSPEGQLEMWQQIAVALRYDGSYPYEVLQKGDVGYEVTMLQTRLQELSYYEKTVVNNFANGTYNALRNFQSQNGLKVDGIATVETQQLLFSSAAKAYVQRTTTTTNNNNTNTNTKNDANTSATP